MGMIWLLVCLWAPVLWCQGQSTRQTWTTSRITGSAEPPPPYLAERAFPKLQFAEPIELVPYPGSKRLAVAELKGKIHTFINDQGAAGTELFADLKKTHPDLSNLYGLAFHPGFATNREVFICYVLKDGDPNGSRVSRFKARPVEPPVLDLDSEEVLLTFLGGGHNGGSIHFGNDGYLYISTGDGRGPDPPDDLNTGQDNSDLLSSILRIDVNRRQSGLNYAIPADNPLVGKPGLRGEVWAYGLRNPWRMSFDRETGDLWVGDVGWELWEMIYRVQKGGNYGWSVVEGKQSIKPGGQVGPTPILPPAAIHPHSEAASITGGYVYRGRKLDALRGAYIYADWETGKIWALRRQEGQSAVPVEITDTSFKIVAFGEDADRELYFLDSAGGSIQQLVKNPQVGKPSDFPVKLSETGLFSTLSTAQPAPGLAAFEPASPLWRDGASASRWIGIPGDGKIRVKDGAWIPAKDSVWAKTYTLETLDRNGRPGTQKIETQVLHFNGDSWGAYSYRWNDEQNDAILVDNNGAEARFRIADPDVLGGATDLTWRFHARAECLRCHNPWCGTLLGFNPAQLSGNGVLEKLAAAGWFDGKPEMNPLVRLTNPANSASNPELAARSYLHANCSHCHREHAGGSVMVFMNAEFPLERSGLIDGRPTQGTFGLPDARVIAPGDPLRSVLLYRMAKIGKGHMPYLGTTRVDPTGLRVLGDWIERIPVKGGPAAPTHPEITSALKTLASTKDTDNASVRSSIDQLLKTSHGALALARSVSGFHGPVSQLARERGIESSNPLIHDLFERFQPEEKRAKTLGIDFQPDQVLGLPGNAERGRKLFFQEGGAQCFSCHKIGSEGRMFGPELTHIGTKYTADKLLEHIRTPSSLIEPPFAGYMVETRQDQSLTGILMSRDENQVVIRTATGEDVKIARKDVTRMEVQKLSLMPEGLLQSMTAQQAADLLEYLSAQK